MPNQCDIKVRPSLRLKNLKLGHKIQVFNIDVCRPYKYKGLHYREYNEA